MEHGVAYVFLAEGFEEIEGLTVVDILRRGKVDTRMISVTGKREVTGSHGITVQADSLFEETGFSDGVLFVLPGGMPGTIRLREHGALGSLLRRAKDGGRRIAAICAAPSVLGALGLLQGETAVCYPGFEKELTGAKIGHQEVAVSGLVTTSRGMGTAIPFALSLLAQLTDEETAGRLAEGIIYAEKNN